MMNEEQRVAHLSWRWATSYGPVGMPASLPSSTTPPVIPANRRNLRPLPGVVCPRVWRKGTRYVIPPVFPANAGIHVASPVSYAPRVAVQAHGTSSLPSFRRKPESTSPPRCHMPVSWRRSLTRRPKLNLLSLRVGVNVDSGFRRKDDISATVTVALPPNSRMTHVSRLSRDWRMSPD